MNYLWYLTNTLNGIIDFLMMLKFAEIFLKPKHSFLHYKALFNSTFLILLITHIISNIFESYIFLLIYILIYLLYIFLRYEGHPIKKALIVIIEPLLIGTLGVIYEILLQHYIWSPEKISNSSFIYLNLRMFIVCITFYIIISLLEIKKNKLSSSYKNPYIKNIILILLLNLIFLLFVVGFYCNSNYTQQAFESLIGIIFICVMFIIICTIWLHNSLVKHLQNEYEINLRLQFNEMQQDYYDKITESSKALSSLRHDLKNHLIVLDGYLAKAKPEEARGYIKDIIKTTTDSNTVVNLENIMLSAMLTQKKTACTEKKIAFHYQITMGTLTIPDTDLCILLGNILDNAIEASEQVTDEKGYIDLELNDSNEILSIHCSNNYHIEPIMQNGKLVTTKTSRILHGIGMQNIADMVKKYDGSMEYQYSDQVFSIDVLLKY